LWWAGTIVNKYLSYQKNNSFGKIFLIYKQMKNIILPILFFVITNTYSQQIRNRITYHVSLKLDDINIEEKLKTKKKYAIEAVKKMFKNAHPVTGFLVFDKNDSEYFLEKQLPNEADNNFNLIESMAGGSRIYFTNSFSKKNLELECEVLGKCFFINNRLIAWKVTQDEKEIAGFRCFKAIGKENNKEIIAWFSPDIPYNFGPLSYRGLPGVILELKKNRTIFKAVKIELNSIGIKKPKKPKKVKEITRKQYNQLLRKGMPEFFN